MPKNKCRDWVVRFTATVIKETILTGCTEEEARANPWAGEILEERDVEHTDWEVQSVEPNE